MNLAMVGLAALALACGACDEQDIEKTSQTASPNTATRSAASPSVSAAALKPAKPKAYKHAEAQQLGTSPEGVGIAVGAEAPDFELPDQNGKRVKLSQMLKDSRVLLTFYRGGW